MAASRARRHAVLAPGRRGVPMRPSTTHDGRRRSVHRQDAGTIAPLPLRACAQSRQRRSHPRRRGSAPAHMLAAHRGQTANAVSARAQTGGEAKRQRYAHMCTCRGTIHSSAITSDTQRPNKDVAIQRAVLLSLLTSHPLFWHHSTARARALVLVCGSWLHCWHVVQLV